MAKNAGKNVISRATNGTFTRVPANLSDARAMAAGAMGKTGDNFLGKLGMKNVSDLQGLREMTKNMTANALKKATDGVVTKLPTSVAEAKQMAKDVMEHKGKAVMKKLTGSEKIPKSMAEVKEMAKNMTLKCLSNATGGLVTTLPSSFADAKAMVTKVMKTKGMAYFKNMTGYMLGRLLLKVPQSMDEAKGMMKDMTGQWLNKTTGGMIPKVPSSMEEVGTMVKAYMLKKAEAWFKNFTGLSKMPKNMDEVKKMAKNMAENALKKFTGGILDKFPKTIDEAKEMAKKLAMAKGKEMLSRVTGLDGLPSSPEEAMKMAKG